MQLFRSEDEVAYWSEATGRTIGAVFSPQQLWSLAKVWWDDRLDLDWKRRSVGERQALLTAAGLTGEFWDLGDSQ